MGTGPADIAPRRDAEASTPAPDLRGFLLVLRRALLLVVGYIEETCQVGGKRRG